MHRQNIFLIGKIYVEYTKVIVQCRIQARSQGSGTQSKFPNLNKNGQKSHFREVFLTQNPVRSFYRSSTDCVLTLAFLCKLVSWVLFQLKKLLFRQQLVFRYCTMNLTHQSISSTNIPPGQPPGFCTLLLPRGQDLYLMTFPWGCVFAYP